jgi:hypothetical protein
MNAKKPMTPRVICNLVRGLCSRSGMGAILPRRKRLGGVARVEVNASVVRIHGAYRQAEWTCLPPETELLESYRSTKA